MKEFCQETSLHGLRTVVRQHQRFLRIIWGFIVAGGFLGLALHLYFLVSNYLSFDFIQSTSEKRDGFYFPDVTVCNLNGISHSNLKQLAKQDKSVMEMVKHLQDTKSRISLPANPKFLVNSFEEAAYLVGHKQHDFILKCKVKFKPCKEENLVVFRFPPYLNCFTFKKKGKTALNGFQSGLSMIIYLEPVDPDIVQPHRHEFLHTDAEGIRVLLTPPNVLPALGYAGHDVVPGVSTSIGFDVKEHHRLPEPYNGCRNGQSLGTTGDYGYSYSECRNCVLRNLLLKNVDADCRDTSPDLTRLTTQVVENTFC